jgi:hypothetical protein
MEKGPGTCGGDDDKISIGFAGTRPDFDVRIYRRERLRRMLCPHRNSIVKSES